MHDFSSDPYGVLRIARDATQKEVKQAYGRLAMKSYGDLIRKNSKEWTSSRMPV
jgi:curved DNA-binding protein CbpA